jgi:hypothetical protein
MPFAKHFTVSEAQESLKRVIPKLEELAQLKSMLDRKGYDVYRHQYFGGMGPNGQKVFPAEMEALVILVTELNKEGIEVKDLNTGLIDFPALRVNGEEVYLCFKLGETAITHWHTIDGGFTGRKPLAEL